MCNPAKNCPTVEILSGKHSTEIPKNANRLLAILFKEAGIPEKDTVACNLAYLTKASGFTPIYKLGQITLKNNVELRLKSDSNDSRFLYYIQPPNGMSPQELHTKLDQAISKLQPKQKVKEETQVIMKQKEVTPVQLNRIRKAAKRSRVNQENEKKTRRENIKKILGDEEMLKLFLDSLFENSIEQVIDRKTMAKVIEEAKLNCSAKHMENFLVKRGFLERESPKGSVVRHRILHEISLPPSPDDNTLSKEFKMIADLRIEASLYESICEEIKEIENSILTLQERLNVKKNEAAKTIKAKEKLIQICSILGISE